SKDSDYAMVLTNGHCYEDGFTDPGSYLVDQPSQRTFAILDPTGEELGELTASKVLYTSMTKTDITLYQLQETYADIKAKYNVRPFTVASQHPAVHSAIEVISGFWKRGYSCQIEAFVNELEEGGYTWSDSVRYSRPGCEVIGGTSGSPVVLAGTRT